MKSFLTALLTTVLLTSTSHALYAQEQVLPPPCAVAISGPDLLCGSNSNATYRSGSNGGVYWTATPASLFTTTSYSGATFVTSAAPGASGTGTITAKIYNCPGAPTITKTVTVDNATGIKGYYSYSAFGTPGTPTIPITNGQQFINSPAGNYLVDMTAFNTATGTVVSSTFDPINTGVSGDGCNVNGVFSNNSSRVAFTLANGCAAHINAIARVASGCDFFFYCRFAGPGMGRSAATTNGVTAAPNPVADILTVTAPAPTTSTDWLATPSSTRLKPTTTVTIKLINSFGATVKSQQGKQGSLQVNTLDLPNGLYTLQVSSGGQTTIQRIEVAH